MKLKSFLLLLLISINVYANNNPLTLLKSVLYEVNSINKVSPSDARYIVNNNLLALFDIDYMTDDILSVANIKINKELRENVKAFIRQNLADTLFYQLRNKGLHNFKIKSALPIAYNTLKVKVRVNSSSSPFSINISLIIRSYDEYWSIVDILIGNSSLLTYYKRALLIQLYKNGIISRQ